MSDPRIELLGARVQDLAAGFAYPPTPDVAGRVRARLARPAQWPPVRPRARLVWAALLLALAAGLVLAVPQTRAALVEWLRIGVVRILLVPPSSPASPAVAPTPTLLPSLLDLDGRTTLAEARRQTGLTVPLPAYPDGLGAPDYVFVQQFDRPLVVLVWTDPDRPDRVRLSLQMVSSDSYIIIGKLQPTLVATTAVNGDSAIWAEGPYLLAITGGTMEVRRLIDGHVLIWQADSVTYRLETGESLAEALKIAGSLK
jgi:hypothetical protein